MNLVSVLVLCLGHVAAAMPSAKHVQTVLSQAPVLVEKPGVTRGVKTNATKDLVGPAHHKGADLHCGVTTQVGPDTDKYEDCPDTCPYFAQNRRDAEHCTFVCVPAQECRAWNPNKPIPDLIKSSKTCRGPKVDFCTTPALDGTDTCVTCQSGFKLFIEDGQCHFQYFTALYTVGAIVAVIATVVAVWVIDFCCRPTINADEFKRGQEFRTRSKIMQPRDANGRRHPYPIETNLCKTDVAGPGMQLHFNFQAFLIFWPLVIAIVWTVLASFHNELFYLGTRRFGTPRHNCILVAWGYETQQRLMWTKVLFLVIVYLFSFVSFLLFGVRQHRMYERMDAQEKTMKDFAVELKGLPALAGDANVEDMIKKAVVDATGKRVVGVSVAWNFGENEEEIMKAVKDDQREREEQLGIASQVPTNTDAPEDMNGIRKKMYEIEKSILGPDEEEESTPEATKTMLQNMVSSESAYVVFNTEDDKNAAIDVAQSGSIKLKHGSEEYTLTLDDLECDPFTVNWANFGDTSPEAMMRRFLYGFFTVYLPALAIWFFVFYVPYAYSLYNFNYDNGAELPGYYGLVFTMVVVGGNATMYVVCDMCCDIIGFQYKDTKQVVYMLFYLAACMINVFLDMAVTYQTAMKVMVGLDFRTYHGQRIAEIESFTEQFETYAMQRSLAENTYSYAFPSTFLIPFLIEPIITVLVPYQLGKKIISSHREIYGSCTEAYIAAFDFDMGRYADILLNVFLGILIFYFPGGYTWSLFYGMFISHIVIYIFDHWRVLYVIPSIKIVSKAVDWWAQATMGACCAMIMCVLVFKMNCETYAGYCLQTTGLLTACTVGGVVHFIVHMLLLIYMVPAVAHAEYEDENANMQYAEVARSEASTWFTVNPVHCLRSKYIHKDKPHCRFVSVGKEHLQQANPKIGCYFVADPGDVEEWTDYKLSDFGDTAKAVLGSLSSIPKSSK